MKEKINVKDLAINSKYPGDDELCIDDWDTCVEVERKQISFDSEKGFVDYRVVIQRISDGKFFKFEYTQFGCNGNNIREQIAVEVEEKEKVIKYYK